MSSVSVARDYEKQGSLDSFFFLPAFAKSFNVLFAPSKACSVRLLHHLVLELCL